MTVLTINFPLKLVWRSWLLFLLIMKILDTTQLFRFFHDDGSLGWVMGMALVEIYVVIMLIITAIRFFKKPYKDKDPVKKIMFEVEAVTTIKNFKHCVIKITNFFDKILLFTLGISLSLSLIKFIAFALSGSEGAFSIHAKLIFGSTLAFLVMLRVVIRNKTLFWHNVAISFSSFFATFALISSMSLFHPYFVVKDAINKANGNAYCVSLNGRNSRAVNSVEDLTFLTMDKNGYPHHAYLLIEGKKGDLTAYYWSYRQSKFVSGVVNWNNENAPSIYCRPSKEFFEKAKLIEKNKRSYSEFYMNNYFWKVDNSYSPRAGNKYIAISAQVPTFKPSKTGPGLFGNSVSISMRSRSFMQSSYDKYKEYKTVRKVGDLINIKGNNPNKDFYYRLDGDDKIATTATCYASRPPQIACQHRFYKNGAMYSFDHSINLLDNSSQMENDIFKLFESFKDKQG